MNCTYRCILRQFNSCSKARIHGGTPIHDNNVVNSFGIDWHPDYTVFIVEISKQEILGDYVRKQIANIITISRILCSIGVLLCPVFFFSFYAMYLFCGFTDMIDGTIARKTNSVSKFGARLDTAADFVFVVVCLVKILPLIHLPVWIWIWIVLITTIKIGNILLGFARRKRLISVHTILNKITGFFLFLFPVTIVFIEPIYRSVMVCSLATVSAINELYYIRMDKDIF